VAATQIGVPVLVGLIALALCFDFLNGLHDAANSIATVVSTRVLRPLTAVFWAAFFNFLAVAVFGLHVAQTLGKGLIDPEAVDAAVIFGALAGAIAWNITSWLLAFPTSSSHALIGGLLGAGAAHAGLGAVVWSGVVKTTIGIVLAPLCGFVLAVSLVIGISWLVARLPPFTVDHRFRRLQLLSAALYSLGHGGNDAQKTMGIIAILLYSGGHMPGGFHVPWWVVLSCQGAMAFGTMCGGWRIVRTMGSRITHLTPMQGWCAETGGAATLFGATWLGVPVSTTHTITGGIIGGRIGAAALRRAMGRCRRHHHRLDRDDAGSRHRRCSGLSTMAAGVKAAAANTSALNPAQLIRNRPTRTGLASTVRKLRFWRISAASQNVMSGRRCRRRERRLCRFPPSGFGRRRFLLA